MPSKPTWKGTPFPPRLWFTLIAVAACVGFAAIAFATMATRIEPGYIGVIINNFTGAIETQTQPGVVYHLPFGLTDVYTIDSRLQVFEMSEESGEGEEAARVARSSRRSAGGDAPARGKRVKIKTVDGGDVFLDLTVNYILEPSQGQILATLVGVGDEYKRSLMRSYARSLIRDGLGELAMVGITDPSVRSAKLGEAQDRLNAAVSAWGLKVETVSATNFSFNPRYEELIKERKSVDQDVRNQAAAQETSRREKETLVNSATREKNVEVRQVQGELAKRLIAAEGEATKIKTEADGEAYRIRKAGEQAFAVAQSEATAVAAEGLKRAEGILALSDAYRRGGLALVMEALAKKYAGRAIRGRPYDLESTVDRLRLEEGAGAAAAAKKGATP
jgi:regulator of protease activity HflC (stomatin/prohibitin superfamily)